MGFETEIRPFSIGDSRVLEFLERVPSRGLWGEIHRGNWGIVLAEPDKEMVESGIEPFPNVRIAAERDRKVVGLCIAETRRFKSFFELWDGKAEEGDYAWIEGICAISDPAKCMTDLLNYLSSELSYIGVKKMQYPGHLEMGDPLTRLSINDLGAQAFFREIGFRLLDMHYLMSLDLTEYVYPRSVDKLERRLHEEGIAFVQTGRGFTVYKGEEEIGSLRWAGQTVANLGMEVHRPFRNKGIGTVLMAKSLSQMRSLGASVARLDVHADNIPALKLYDRYQFKVEKTYLYMLKELGH